MIAAMPSSKYLKQCFEYDADTGNLYWKIRPESHFKHAYTAKDWNSRYPGNIVGSLTDEGYRRVIIHNKKYRLHRIIWKMFTNKEPKCLIDHIDRNPRNNKIENLREATVMQNSSNRTVKRANKTGYLGVTFVKTRNKFQGCVMSGGKHLRTNYFVTAKEAFAARCLIANKVHKQFHSHV